MINEVAWKGNFTELSKAKYVEKAKLVFKRF